MRQPSTGPQSRLFRIVCASVAELQQKVRKCLGANFYVLRVRVERRSIATISLDWLITTGPLARPWSLHT